MNQKHCSEEVVWHLNLSFNKTLQQDVYWSHKTFNI